MRIAALMLAPLALAGCVQTIAEDRVRSALVKAGLSESDSQCMAGRMVDRLTIAQLKKLERIRNGDANFRPRTLSDYVEAVRRVGDAEVVAVTASSAGLCATGLAR